MENQCNSAGRFLWVEEDMRQVAPRADAGGGGKDEENKEPLDKISNGTLSS